MKNSPELRSIVLLSIILVACGKSGQGPAIAATPYSTVSVSVNDSLLHYTVNLVYMQDVGSTHTTLISAEYADTSGKKGSLAIRLPGDTTGRFSGNDLHITYTDGKGNEYYNTADTTNYVQLDKYPKTDKGIVSGQFSFVATGGAKSVKFSNGSIVAIFQK